jgi:hypothetical protein
MKPFLIFSYLLFFHLSYPVFGTGMSFNTFSFRIGIIPTEDILSSEGAEVLKKFEKIRDFLYVNDNAINFFGSGDFRNALKKIRNIYSKIEIAKHKDSGKKVDPLDGLILDSSLAHLVTNADNAVWFELLNSLSQFFTYFNEFVIKNEEYTDQLSVCDLIIIFLGHLNYGLAKSKNETCKEVLKICEQILDSEKPFKKSIASAFPTSKESKTLPEITSGGPGKPTTASEESEKLVTPTSTGSTSGGTENPITSTDSTSGGQGLSTGKKILIGAPICVTIIVLIVFFIYKQQKR